MPGKRAAHLLGGLEALPLEGRRHPDIGHHHLGFRIHDPGDETVVVGSFPDDLQVGLGPQEGGHTRPHQEVVVRQEHADPSHGVSLRRNSLGGKWATWLTQGEATTTGGRQPSPCSRLGGSE